MAMEQIGLYKQLTKFTAEHAGTAEWCKVERDGKEYFVKKFYSPVYPSKEIGLPEKMYAAGVKEFHSNINRKEELYQRLRECDQSGVLVVPVEVMNYQFHICTIAEYVKGNVNPEQIHLLSEWQRLVLMRTLTLALMNVHKAGIVHSDMKPENVLVTQEETGHCKLRLIDFDGSFFEAEPPTDPEDVVGDPTFFSPEAYQQSMDEDIRLDHRIDIFALGIIFHYYWTGSYPQKPKNRTIGECLVLNEPVTIDETIPLVLRQLILKMIEKDPEKRISLKSVYDVLGVQIGLYPPKIIELVKEEKITPRPEEEKKTAKVIVKCYDEDGILIRSKTMMIPYGSVKILTAEKIEGYYVTGPQKKEIKVSASGFAETPVTFRYEKENKERKTSKLRKILIALGILFIIYVIVMAVLADSAKGSGDYETANQYLDAIPLYKEIFTDEYNECVYNSAIQEYNQGYYRKAYGTFKRVKGTFINKALWMDFCRAHTDDPSEYYSQIVGHLDFADAKEILAENNDLFCRYMVGKWTFTSPSSSDKGTVIMKDDYHVQGMPELPDGGTYRISNGIWKYWYKGSDNSIDYYKITVQTEDLFCLYSYLSGTTYTLKRWRSAAN